MIEIMIDLQGERKLPSMRKYMNISNGMSLKGKFRLEKNSHRQDFWQNIWL